MIDRAHIHQVAETLAPFVRRTPAIALPPGTFGLPCSLVIKLESLQHAGSFKARGAFAKLLASEVPPAGVAAASGGNHGIAVAHAARVRGVPAEIFVHANTAPAKRARLAALGAKVHVCGTSYAEAEAACRQHVERAGASFVPAFDDPTVVAGQGTLARELEQQAKLDTLLLSVGGGGLLAGCAAWYRGEVRIIGVETTGTASLHRALAAGQPVDVDVGGLAADALGAKRIGALPFQIAKELVHDSLLIDDDSLRRAQHALWTELRVGSEPAAAAGLAALLTGVYRPAAEERVGIVVCGANVDPASLSQVAVA
ncbi:serine/threonine dehydratase [Pendulispora albinea]|uniref:Serine/threonine dehydratase n=1 Tax=Pendulispora albinea TaxID=2741071 RepID=A0ABZ2MBH2_9BACT